MRFIGDRAFYGTYLESIDFYVYKDKVNEQVRIGKDAFPESVKDICIHYVESSPVSFSSPSYSYSYLEDIDLSAKLNDPDYRAYVGLQIDSTLINVRTIDDTSTTSYTSFSAAPLMKSSTPIDVDSVSSPLDDAMTITVKDFLSYISKSPAPLMRGGKMMLAAAKPVVDIDNVFKLTPSN